MKLAAFARGKSRLMKPAPIAIATSALLLLALSGCAAGTAASPSGSATSGAGSSGAPSSSTPSAAPAQTYTADDLVAILKKAQATLKAGGTILDDAQLVASFSKVSGGSISTLLSAHGAKITPASCLANLQNAVPDGKKFATVDGIGAALTYSKGFLSVMTQKAGSATPSISSGVLANVDSLLASCSIMKISISGIAVTLRISKLGVTTDAERTYGFSETASVGGKTLTTTFIEAVDGSLFIEMSEVAGSPSDAVAAVNATVAAAK
jgi:hypothetical protein